MRPCEVTEVLSPPPPKIPLNIESIRVQGEDAYKLTKKTSEPKRDLLPRPGYGTKGQKVLLLSNHFKVGITNATEDFFCYSVSMFYEDHQPIDGKTIGRKVIDEVRETYDSELGKIDFVYDGERSLFTVGPLPQNKFSFAVVLNADPSKRNGNPRGNGSPSERDRKRPRRVPQYKIVKVDINFAAKIPVQAPASALRGQESENSQEALGVLNIILRQHAAKRGCFVVRQSFFLDDSKNFTDLGGGVLAWRGFHSSFQATQGGLSLNIDGSSTTTVQPGPVVDFLLANQSVSNPLQVDWAKAKQTLKNLRIKVIASNREFRIKGLSKRPCKEQTFSLRLRGQQDGDDHAQSVVITVYDYFVNYRRLKLLYSADLPCLNIGRSKKPTYYPLELCLMVSLQRYTKALTVHQRSLCIKKSRQNPQEKIRVLTDVMKGYGADPMLRSCGISIQTHFTQVEGRVLSPTRLKFGSGETLIPHNGQWSINNRNFVEPAKISRWAVVNFSARCDIHGLCGDLAKIGEIKGITMDPPLCILEENPQFRRDPPPVRIEKMFEQIGAKFPGGKWPHFILCLLADRKNNDLYGPWKKKNLVDCGIFTQCLAPTRVNEPYLTNVLLKINAKLGGLNSILSVEPARSIPMVSNKPTMIFGMDVSHAPGYSNVPSVAAVVGSRHWPLVSRYRASVRSQSSRAEMIDSLFEPKPNNQDTGIVRELLKDFYSSSGKRKPSQIIIFRDGVSESEFTQVLNIELGQIIEACKFLDENWCPKFTFVVAQKRHHTKFFQAGSQDNVRPGTVIDAEVCHHRNFDFYMCPHAGMGTTRPILYHVLFDEIGFSPDDLQELIHSLSYVFQRSTSAISIGDN